MHNQAKIESCGKIILENRALKQKIKWERNTKISTKFVNKVFSVESMQVGSSAKNGQNL